MDPGRVTEPGDDPRVRVASGVGPQGKRLVLLDEAKALLTAAEPPTGEPIDDLVSADFEQLRWFELPPACLAGTAM